LVDCRQKLASELKVDVEKIELSMGMSHDFELAVSVKLLLLSYSRLMSS